jgi:acetyl-CoA C-acetyltransferase
VPDAVICEPIRTAVGRYGGALKDLPAHSLAATVVKALVERTGIAPDEIDDVVFGHCYPTSEAPAIGRVAALDAGLPVTVPGLQIDRRCGSSLQAVIYAIGQVTAGQATAIVAGGAESMSNVPYYTNSMRWGARSGEATMFDPLTRGRSTPGGKYHPVPGGMLETAENLRRDYSISRLEQDEYSARSHERAVAAAAAGHFKDEIVPVEVPAGRAGTKIVDTDEHPRPGTTAESLGSLKPLLGDGDPESTVTAGNASGQNDAASACLITTAENADRLGLRPMGRLVSWGVAGVAPKIMGIGPVPASELALSRANLSMADMDLIELNEAFAAQVLACTREWKFGADDFDRFNVAGSGISLGHPVGATGTRILATMLREMDRRGSRYGLETLCIGGGQGIAAIFERTS